MRCVPSSESPSAGGGEALPPAFILRNRNFLLLWCAYTTSALGDHLSEMALLDMQDATHRDDSTRISAIMMFALMLPFFLFGPVMGWLADRLPRRWIMIAADVVRAALMLSLAGLLSLLFGAFAGGRWELRAAMDGHPPIFNPWLYAVPLFVTGLFASMFSPARAALLPTLIRPEQLIRGNGLMSAMGPIATIASFLIGAELVARYGATANFRVDGLTFLASATLVLMIRAPRRRSPAAGAIGQNSLVDGLRYCLGHRRVMELIIFAVLFWAAAGVVRSVIPALVGHVFGGDIRDIGYYQASLGIGMLFGAMVLAGLGDAVPGDAAITWSLIGAGLAAAWLTAVSVFRIGQIPGGVGLFVTGMFGSGVLVSTNALLQRIVPDCFRGRVFGVMDVLSVGGLLLATGALALPELPGIDRFVPAILLAVGGVLFGAGVVALRLRMKRGCFRPAVTFWRNLAVFHNRLFARVRREGVCTIPASGPVILAANHRCSLDPFLLISTSPNRMPSFMVAEEYTRWPLFGRLVRLIDCIPVNRSRVDTASVRAALRRLERGGMLGLFPQGGIQHPDEPPRVQAGIGLLALHSGATVVPAHVSGTRYSDGVVAPFLRRHRAVVRYGRPIDLSAWRGREKDRNAHREVAEHVMQRILELGGESRPC